MKVEYYKLGVYVECSLWKTVKIELFDKPEWSLLDIWGITNKNNNWGISILPLKFWRHIYFLNKKYHDGKRRFGLELVLFSFFFDFRLTNFFNFRLTKIKNKA